MAGGQSIYSGLQHALKNKELYDGCYLRCYDTGGVYPTDATKPVVGTLLAIVSNDGTATGVTWATPTDNVLYKEGTEIWREDSCLATGNIDFVRLSLPADDNTERTDIQRFDFIAGTYAQYEADITAQGYSLITAKFVNQAVSAGIEFRINSASLTSVLSVSG